MVGLSLLLAKMLAPSLSRDSVSSLQHLTRHNGILTRYLDLLKTWVEENLDLYKVSNIQAL
jgi:hypothetical protein